MSRVLYSLYERQHTTGLLPVSDVTLLKTRSMNASNKRHRCQLLSLYLVQRIRSSTAALLHCHQPKLWHLKTNRESNTVMKSGARFFQCCRNAQHLSFSPKIFFFLPRRRVATSWWRRRRRRSLTPRSVILPSSTLARSRT